jgi:iron-sulfur cluster repair protein YtfE (RIC family)
MFGDCHQLLALPVARGGKRLQDMHTYSYPTRTPCETEWSSKSLTELVAYLNQRYRRPLQQRLESIRSLFGQEASFEDDGRRADYERLGNSFERLRGTLDEHAWLEDEVLCPAVARVEYSIGASDPRAREALCMLVTTVADEHRLIRTRIDELERALASVCRCTLSQQEALLVADLEMLELLLSEQIELEDRCLWPRALTLLQPGP